MQKINSNQNLLHKEIYNQLPMKCAAYIETEGVVALITKGVKGYLPMLDADKRFVKEFNKDNGVDSAIQKAMIFGATISWKSAGIDPSIY